MIRSRFGIAGPLFTGALLLLTACANEPSPTPTPTPVPTATPTITPPKPEVTQIVIGKHYNYFPGSEFHDQATVEYVDLSGCRDSLFVVTTQTRGYRVRVGVYQGRIDLSKWWGDSAPLVRETEFEVDTSVKVFLSPAAGLYSIVYITRPVKDHTPESLEITRRFSIETPKYPADWSQTFVTEFWTFPDDILTRLVTPPQFNDNMNREYAALKDLVGRHSAHLDAEGHIRLIVEDIPYCGLAGNPIRMDPVCMDPDLLNSGNPGWGPAHELGHDFVLDRHFAGAGSYFWEEGDGSEGWANFMAFYAFDNKIFVNSDYDSAFWANVWETSPKPTDIFQGLIVRLAHQYTWDIAKVFFRKYIAADPARDANNTQKQKQAVRYLAESAREVTARQDAYDYVVDYLTRKGFPRP